MIVIKCDWCTFFSDFFCVSKFVYLSIITVSDSIKVIKENELQYLIIIYLVVLLCVMAKTKKCKKNYSIQLAIWININIKFQMIHTHAHTSYTDLPLYAELNSISKCTLFVIGTHVYSDAPIIIFNNRVCYDRQKKAFKHNYNIYTNKIHASDKWCFLFVHSCIGNKLFSTV